MFKLIVNNPDLIKLANQLICRIQVLSENHPFLISEMEKATEKANLFHFISQYNTEYQWSEIKKDLKEAYKYNNDKEHRPAQDIIEYKKVQRLVSTQISEHKHCIYKKDMNEARKSLKRAGNKKNTEMYDFDLYPNIFEAKNIILLFITYHNHISGLRYQDAAHQVGQIIINEALASITKSRVWSITDAILRNLKEYEYKMQEFDSDDYIDYFSEFVKFMLKISLQQVEHLEKMTRTENMLDEIQKYILVHNNKNDADKIPEYAILLLQKLLLTGEIPRKKVPEIIDKKSRMAQYLNLQLLGHGLITSDTPRGKIRLALGYCSPSSISDT